jgi:hypothetical protein
VLGDPAVGQVERDAYYQQPGEQGRGSPRPALNQAQAATQQVSDRHGGRGPHGTPEGVVEEEGTPAHPARASYQSAEDAQAGEEAGEEDGLAPVPAEERFGASQPLGGDEGVASPAQHERTAPFAADPVADLVAQDCPEYPEHHGGSEV